MERTSEADRAQSANRNSQTIHGGVRGWETVWNFLRLLRKYHRLFYVVLAATLFCTFAWYLTSKPTYTAEAVIGPPGPTLGGAGASIGGGGASSLANKMLGGVGSGNSDSYQSFLQLLPSTRLSQTLISRDHILPIVFHDNWDPQTRQWKRPGLIQTVANEVKELLNIPVQKEPGVEDLTKYFASHLVIVQSKKEISGSLLPNANPFAEVSLKYDGPREAEDLLNLVLLETDRLIRDDLRRDVAARIAYLRGEISREPIAVDERAALISALSNQECQFAMIQADQRFASRLVVPPYASVRRTSPPGLGIVLADALLAALLIWAGVVFLASQLTWVNKKVAWALSDYQPKTPSN
jgi:hypothetical protein